MDFSRINIALDARHSIFKQALMTWMKTYEDAIIDLIKDPKSPFAYIQTNLIFADYPVSAAAFRSNRADFESKISREIGVDIKFDLVPRPSECIRLLI